MREDCREAFRSAAGCSRVLEVIPVQRDPASERPHRRLARVRLLHIRGLLLELASTVPGLDDQHPCGVGEDQQDPLRSTSVTL